MGGRQRYGQIAGRKGPSGNLVTIRHHGGFESSYAHLHRIQSGVRKGARIDQRQAIGVVGSTGRSTGPHLHFALRKHGRFLDPLDELNGPGLRLTKKHLPGFKKRIDPLATQLDALANSGPQPVIATSEPSEVEPQDEAMD